MLNKPLPDAEAQCQALAQLIAPHWQADTLLIGIHSGGVWVAKRLHELLNSTREIGEIDVSFYRDDFGEKGLHPQIKPSLIPYGVDNRNVILVDDVLYTGRTTRAAINELFDYGRPASIQLAVLADRGARQLPIAPDFCTWQVKLEPNEELLLKPDDAGKLSWRYHQHA